MRRVENFKAVLLSTLVITSFLASLLIIITAEPLKASPDGEQADPVEDFLPTDDSHVTENQPDTVADGGQKYNMYVGWDEQVYLSERIYLKFDLSGIPAGSIIDSAALKIYNKFRPSIGEAPYSDKTIVVEARSVSDDSWLESTITWDNAPPMGTTVLDSQTIDKGFGDPGDTSPELWEWWSFDVTSHVASEFAGDNIVSIGLISQNEGTDDATVWFYSKDAFEDQPRPHLSVSYSGTPLVVSISPSENTGNPGETLEYVVTVTNGTGGDDTFDLTVDSEWEASLPSSVGPIPDGGSADVTLTITIPEIYGGVDEITVTATSRVDPNVSDSESCIARSFPIYPSDDAYVIEERPDQNTDGDDVDVGTVISLDNWENRRGYLKFNLSGKIPSTASIDNAYLSIYTHYGGENGYPYGDATLTVDAKEVEDDDWSEDTITWDNAPPMGAFLDSQLIPPTDDVRYQFDVTSHVASDVAGGDIVISIGLVSGEEGQNKFVPFTAKESEYWEGQESYLILYYSMPTYSVSTSISPDNQDGEPGDTLSYTVTVTNEGNNTDIYDLSASGTEVWSLSLSQDTVTLSPGENSITLTVSIPGTAEMGTEDTVTVTATSQADSDVRGWDTCIARAGGREVSVSISPDEKTGAPGDTVTFTVTVTNEGTSTDTFSLQATDTASWSPSISPSTLTLAAGASGTTTLTVTIPAEGGSTTITVTASGTGYEDTSTVLATTKEEGLPITLIAIVVVVVVVVALMLLRSRRAAPSWTS